jgi:hypothetical protein
MSGLSLELLKGSFTLGAAALGAWIALNLYFRQKEYELIKQRYLDGAVDVVTAEVEQALGVVSHNWARCLNVVKSFRDSAANFDVAELQKGFLELDSSKFHRVPHHRIGSLVGSQVFWQVYQLAMAYAANSNTVIVKEIPEAIRLKLTTNQIQADFKSMADEMARELRRIDDESHKFALLVRELHALGLMLEVERFRFKGLAQFKDRDSVKQLVSRLAAPFADQIAHHEQESEVA